jgi:type IV pilus assembly protein PilW
LRPIPVLITDSGSDTTSDTFVVNYGASERLVTTVGFKTTPVTFLGSDDYVVQSPLGFQKNDVVVLVSNAGGGTNTGKCTASVVSSVSTPPDADGYVTLSHTVPTDASEYNANSSLLNLGASPRRIQFDVDSNGTLRSQELFHVDVDNTSQPFSAVETPVPVANNIVLMKVQYGIADPLTGYLQKWVKATNDGTEDWSANAVLNAKDYIDLSRIKAVRIALIVRSESYDKCAYADVCPDPTTNAFTYSLFSQCDSIACPAAITGSIDPTPGKGNFRYRVYETVVPLRNAVWNLHKKT